MGTAPRGDIRQLAWRALGGSCATWGPSPLPVGGGKPWGPFHSSEEPQRDHPEPPSPVPRHRPPPTEGRGPGSWRTQPCHRYQGPWSSEPARVKGRVCPADRGSPELRARRALSGGFKRHVSLLQAAGRGDQVCHMTRPPQGGGGCAVGCVAARSWGKAGVVPLGTCVCVVLITHIHVSPCSCVGMDNQWELQGLRSLCSLLKRA